MMKRAVELLDGIPEPHDGQLLPEPELLIGVQSEVGTRLLSYPVFGDPFVLAVPRGRRYAADFALQAAHAGFELGKPEVVQNWLARSRKAIREVPAESWEAPHVAVNLELIRAKELTLRAVTNTNGQRVKRARSGIDDAQHLLERHLKYLPSYKQNEWRAALAGCLLALPDAVSPRMRLTAIDTMAASGAQACKEEPLLFQALSQDAIVHLAASKLKGELEDYRALIRREAKIDPA